jgi:glycerophosphoryl diester phosphodiesterase
MAHAASAQAQPAPTTLTPVQALRAAALSQAAVPAAGTVPGLSTRARRVRHAAHRGASAYAPENTLAAFRSAADRGADLFELDVQQTKDHKLVIVHDTTLARTTNVEKIFPSKKPWRVRDLTLAEIKRLDAGSWFGSKFKGERVPTLGGTLSAMNGRGIDMLLEVKSPSLYPGIGRRVATELRANPSWLGPKKVIVQSFDWGFIRNFHDQLPSAPTGLLGTPSTGSLSSAAKYADYINPPYKDATAGYVSSVHKRGMRVFPWTVNDSSTMRRVIAAGADGVITNRPGAMPRTAG